MARALICILLLSLAGHSAGKEPIYLGFIEEHPEGRVKTGLRVAFRKDPSGWQSLCPPSRDYSNRSQCEVAFDKLPKQWRIVAEKPHSFRIERSDSNYYADAGLYPISNFSMSGSPTMDFAGWDEVAVRPPIPALSRVPASSPGIAGTLVPVDLEAVLRKFRDEVGRVETCSSSGDTTPLRYSDRDLLIRRHKLIPDRFVSVEIDPKLNTCDGPAEANWSTHVYRIDPKGKIHAVHFDLRNSCSQYHCVIRFIASIDADNDGKPESLFWLSSYDEDGYAILPGNSDKPISFTWIYH